MKTLRSAQGIPVDAGLWAEMTTWSECLRVPLPAVIGAPLDGGA
jgi:ureidoglycolate dehydrogenase (NAD+)